VESRAGRPEAGRTCSAFIGLFAPRCHSGYDAIVLPTIRGNLVDQRKLDPVNEDDSIRYLSPSIRMQLIIPHSASSSKHLVTCRLQSRLWQHWGKNQTIRQMSYLPNGTRRHRYALWTGDGINHSIGLSVDSKFVAGDPDALTLLAIVSMLPAGTEQSHMRWWAPTLRNRARAITTLREAALIVDRVAPGSNVISVLPVIQSYMRQTDHIKSVRQDVQKACCRFIRDHKSEPNSSKFKADLSALRVKRQTCKLFF